MYLKYKIYKHLSYNFRNIGSVENWAVSVAAMGEGWHNYHHVFPWDYKAGEFGEYYLNVTTGFLDFMAKIGWASHSKLFFCLFYYFL